MDIKKRTLAAACCLSLAIGSTGCGPSEGRGEPFAGYDPSLRVTDARGLDDYAYTQNNLYAVDDFGRVTETIDGQKTDKKRYVGIFFFLNHGICEGINGIHNVTEMIAEYGEEIFGSDNPISPNNVVHHWGQSAFGYYHSMDTWLMRKQIEMLTMARLDYLVFDCSNATTYDKVTKLFLPILLEYQNQGWKVPQVVWHLYGGSNTAFDEKNLKDIYNDFYVAHPEWDSLWFKPEGKPMIITMRETHERLAGSSSASDRKIASYFHFRYGWWPTRYDDVDPLGFPWMDYTYPQRVFTDVVSVSVAQHTPAVRFSDTEHSQGRGWNYQTQTNEHEKFPMNINFESQWDTVYRNDGEITYVHVTGWNEWGAVKLYHPELTTTHNGYMMCDTFNDEFSRDIEPSYEESLKDNNYLQLIRKMREYSGLPAQHYVYDDSPVDFANVSDPRNWTGASVYKDFTGEAIERNWLSFDGQSYYQDDSGRNDIDTVCVRRDRENLYFRISTVQDVTEYQSGDTGWMNVWISTRNDGAKNEMGYDYVVNRGGIGRVSRYDGKEFRECGEAEIVKEGNNLYLKIPLSVLGLNERNYDVAFKVTDNVQNERDILSFYNSGDSAPIGRLNYRFGY